MATTTAIILIGRAHPNSGGINPTHMLQFTENDRPALILHEIGSSSEPEVVIPTVEDTVHDIYLMIAALVLKTVSPLKALSNKNRDSLYDIFDQHERQALYAEARKAIEEYNVKVVFNILHGSHLLSQTDVIKTYPNDFEVTLPAILKEYNSWGNSLVTIGL